jgi:hypothetical protein
MGKRIRVAVVVQARRKIAIENANNSFAFQKQAKKH